MSSLFLPPFYTSPFFFIFVDIFSPLSLSQFSLPRYPFTPDVSVPGSTDICSFCRFVFFPPPFLFSSIPSIYLYRPLAPGLSIFRGLLVCLFMFHYILLFHVHQPCDLFPQLISRCVLKRPLYICTDHFHACALSLIFCVCQGSSVMDFE